MATSKDEAVTAPPEDSQSEDSQSKDPPEDSQESRPVCPRSDGHRKTRVLSSNAARGGHVVRHCICDDCGESFTDRVKASRNDVAPVKRKQFKATCPHNPAHTARVVKSRGKQRRCVCDGCGAEWTETADSPSDSAPPLPAYPEVRCKFHNHHTNVRAFKRNNGLLHCVCDDCGGFWTVDDEISKPKRRLPSSGSTDRSTPRHRR